MTKTANKITSIMVCAVLVNICAAIFVCTILAYWVWTPETKKFINPKYAVKDSPKEQYDWAMSFYDAKSYERAAAEFDKLTKHYEYSEYASKAQYYAGLSYENMEKYYIAFQNYQKAIDNFPHIDNIDEIIARQFNIGNIYAAKDNPKVLGADIMTSVDRAIEIYKKVVDNAPFGKLADQAQFNMAQVMKRAGRYDEATMAFQKLSEDYPTSPFAEKAQYEIAYCAYRASLQPAYDAAPTDKALKAFEDFTYSNRDGQLSQEANKTIQRLKDKTAEKSYMTADFYDREKHYESAVIYYKDVIARYPGSLFAARARARIEEIKSDNFSGRKEGDRDWLSWIGKAKSGVGKEEKKIEEKKKPAAKQDNKWFSRIGKKEEKKETGPEPTVVQTPEPVVEEKSVEVAPQVVTVSAQASAEEKAEEAGCLQAVPVAAPVEEKKEETSAAPAPVASEPKKDPAPTPLEPKKEETVVQSEPAPIAIEQKKDEVVPQAASKKGWIPFTFGKNSEQPKNTGEVTEKKAQGPAKKGWFPFTFGKSSEQPENTGEVAEKKAQGPAKKGWFPFTFGKSSEEPKDASATTEQSAEKKAQKPAKKGWSPFRFGKKAESQKEEPVEPEQGPVKKGWTPLRFDKKTGDQSRGQKK